ncbi:MAG: hypothetical protein PVF18_04950 [Anaerolineales bacterium]|jgi:hypothetical protein
MEIHPEDLVLVAILPERRDLEIARVLGWYRIPVQSSPKTVDVDWIAFYLTSAFGEERWAVRYIAPVKGHELVKRKDLLADEPDHPRAEEPYIKIQLGRIYTLPKPIPAQGWKRFTFLYTTGEKLKQAHSLSDLRVASTVERALLWRTVKNKNGS